MATPRSDTGADTSQGEIREERVIVLRPAKGRGDSGVSGAPPRDDSARLSEAIGLAEAIGLTVLYAECVRVARVRPSTYFGSGTVERIEELIDAQQADLVVFDGALSPVQQRNLERSWHCKVIDRTGLILEIFGARARTHEGRLQVELAALSFQRSRLVRSWTHLERQRGGFGFLGGPGESQIEMDRRLIDERLVKLRRELSDVQRTRALHRRARQRIPAPIVTLVGYTNAGKSTLFNRLTHAAVFAEDQLFATLDPTMRRVRMPSGREIILSDTVGFISELPTELIAAFRATLEEVSEADIVIHVRDVANSETESQASDVEAVLSALGLREDAVRLEAWNKIDLLSPEDREEWDERAARRADAVPISAVTGDGCQHLLAAIEAALDRTRETHHFAVALADGAAIAWLYAHGRVLTRHDEDDRARLDVAIDPADAARFLQKFPQSTL